MRAALTHAHTHTCILLSPQSLQSSHLQFSASLGDDSSLSLSQDFSISKTHDWRVHHKSRQGLRSRHSRSGTTPATLVRPKIKIEAPKLAPPEGQRSPLKGLPAEDAPSIVISSLASMDNDHDYNYLKNYSSDANGMPMTAKDRARHGMLRTMLRKSLEVTRPNWPKHPNMRSTDRILDEERGMLQKESILKSRGGTSGGMGLGLGLNVSESLPDLQVRAEPRERSDEYRAFTERNPTQSFLSFVAGAREEASHEHEPGVQENL